MPLITKLQKPKMKDHSRPQWTIQRPCLKNQNEERAEGKGGKEEDEREEMEMWIQKGGRK